MQKFLGVCAATVLLAGAVYADDAPKAKNIIVMIGDGMGFNHVDIGSLYEYGETGKEPYESFDSYGVATYGVGGGYEPDKSGDFDYLKKRANDSAATATQMASGVKTYPGAIGVNPEKEPVKLITESAYEAGKAMGVVTSVMFNHATPAAFVAHVPGRTEYHDIAVQMLNSNARVIMGGGHPLFDKEGKPTEAKAPDGAPWEKKEDDPFSRVGGADIWKQLTEGTLGNDFDGDGEADPWTLVESPEDFAKLAAGETPKRVFGLARTGTTLQVERAGDRDAAPFTDPFLDTVPKLETMAVGALNVLNQDPDGFMVMIEGGAIDWASHANVAGRLVEEQIDYNKTIAAVCKWVEEHSSWDETLLVITADHECGYVLGPGSEPALNPIENKGQGVMPGFEFHSGGHTNQLVPMYTKGVGSGQFSKYIEGQDPKHGQYIHDTAIHEVMLSVL
ncbi:MAG: alkaline phosphatase [Candidatus Hydrogenedens sp.]|nr:alkaline phosphatase [Candidatus Hydrogenedens sp.]